MTVWREVFCCGRGSEGMVRVVRLDWRNIYKVDVVREGEIGFWYQMAFLEVGHEMIVVVRL